MIRWALAWGPAAAWAAFLFLLSSRSTLPVNLGSGLDKVAHFAAYLILGFLLTYGTNRLGISSLVAIALGSGYGVLDELHQATVPGRYPSVGDWLADTVGAVVGMTLFFLVLRARGRSGSPPGIDNAEPSRK